MSQHSYSYYENVLPNSMVVTFFFLPLVIFVSAILPVVLLAMTKKGKFCLNILLDKVLYKIFFSSFFVSATIIVAQIFFGAGAIKQKKRNAPVVNPPVGNPPVVNAPVGNPPVMNSPVGNPPVGNPPAVNPPVGSPSVGNPPVVNPLVGNPPAINSPVGDAPADSYVLVINGRKYKLSGFVLGTIVYYNCAVIYVIIAVSISFLYRKIPWSLEACKSSAACYYTPNYHDHVLIQNCTLDEFEAKNVKQNVFCYDVGFRSVVVIALLSSFLKVGTPLLFAFITRPYALFGQKIFKIAREAFQRGETQFVKIIKYIGMVLLFAGNLLIQIIISITLVVILFEIYRTPSVDQNSFEIFLSNEAYISQGIALFCLHFLFIINPFFVSEYYRIQEG